MPINPEFQAWVLSWGAECEVLTPPDLRDHVAQEARKILALTEQSKVP